MMILKIRSRLALFIATVGGVGFLPKAPGTFGTAMGAALVIITSQVQPLQNILFWSILFVLALWATKEAIISLNKPDPGAIVIDEVLGFYVASFGFTERWIELLCAFFLFRFFDIFKFFPVRNIDRWSKNQTSHWNQSFGVIADDLIAGVQAWICLSAMIHFNVL